MAQGFDAEGNAVPLTVLQAGPCTVIQKKSKDKDGYAVLQLGLVEDKAVRRPTKAQEGHFKKSGSPVSRPAGIPFEGGSSRKATRSSSTSSPSERKSTSSGRARERVPGRRQAAPFPRRRGITRVDVPPGARLDRRVVLSVARRPRPADGRTYGPRPGDGPELDRIRDGQGHIICWSSRAPSPAPTAAMS